MQFLIKDKDGKDLFFTEHESCVPVNKFDSMASFGLQFYVDNKKISCSAAKKMFKNTSELKNSKSLESVVYSKDVESTNQLESRNIHTDKKSKAIPFVNVKNTTVDSNQESSFTVTSRTIICINNGKMYKNQKTAGEALGIDPSWISYCINNDAEYKGYKFKKAVDMK